LDRKLERTSISFTFEGKNAFNESEIINFSLLQWLPLLAPLAIPVGCRLAYLIFDNISKGTTVSMQRNSTVSTAKKNSSPKAPVRP